MSAQAIDFQAGLNTYRDPGFVSQSTSSETANARAATNRSNAQHSTGPRTAEGKVASSRNAFKHGLSLQCHAILQHEDPSAYHQLVCELRAIFAPESPREQLAVEDIAECRWAFRRFDEAEATLLEYHFARGANPANDDNAHISYGQTLGYSAIQETGEPMRPEYPSLLLVHRYRGHWERRYQRALAEFDRAQRARRQEARDQRQQAESLRKAEREAAAECRREELHQLRVALADAKLLREHRRKSKSHQPTEEAASNNSINDDPQAPHDDLTEEQIAARGFVSSAQCETSTEDKNGSHATASKASC